MDLQSILERIEANFFNRLKRYKARPGNPINVSEVMAEFNEAIKDVLILTYSRVMKDAKEMSHDS